MQGVFKHQVREYVKINRVPHYRYVRGPIEPAEWHYVLNV